MGEPKGLEQSGSKLEYIPQHCEKFLLLVSTQKISYGGVHSVHAVRQLLYLCPFILELIYKEVVEYTCPDRHNQAGTSVLNSSASELRIHSNS